MHEAVRKYVFDNLDSGYKSVIEVGSLDINGGVRDLVDDGTEYVGIDIQPGPGVDVVADFSTYKHSKLVDRILCLEVLEHAPKWRQIIASAARNLAFDGELIITCATSGRAPHSARSEGPIEIDEYYKNVTQEELDDELSKHFGTFRTLVMGSDLRGFAVNGSATCYSVIIPSCDDAKLMQCVSSIFDTHPMIKRGQIVVVSDGLSHHVQDALRDETWIEGKKPFVFAEAINAGVREAIPGSDIVILGDDVRFETQGGLDALAQSSQGCAVVVPDVIGACGQGAQRKGDPRATADWLAFICAYIPRKAWDAVGELDETFTGYGYDDVDWCRRAAPYGELKIDHSVTVRHLDQSSFRSNPDWQTRYAVNRLRYHEKWAGEGAGFSLRGVSP